MTKRPAGHQQSLTASTSRSSPAFVPINACGTGCANSDRPAVATLDTTPRSTVRRFTSMTVRTAAGETGPRLSFRAHLEEIEVDGVRHRLVAGVIGMQMIAGVVLRQELLRIIRIPCRLVEID